MATYDKPQPQPQPQPGLNAAYYGPAIPPQPPAYYGYGQPVAAPRRSGPGCLLCVLFKIVATVVIVLGAISLVLWLIFRPHAVKAYASYATPYRFDLGGNGGDVLQYNLTVGVRLRNPNRYAIRYDYADAQALYDGDRFGFAPLQPFYLDGKSDGRITVAFTGSAVMADDGARRRYRRESGEGFYYVQVKMYSDLSFKPARTFRVRGYKSKVTCLLRLPAPAANTNFTFTLTRSLETKCDVDF